MSVWGVWVEGGLHVVGWKGGWWSAFLSFQNTSSDDTLFNLQLNSEVVQDDGSYKTNKSN